MAVMSFASVSNHNKLRQLCKQTLKAQWKMPTQYKHALKWVNKVLSTLILALQLILKTPMYILLELINFNLHLNFQGTHSSSSSISHRSSTSSLPLMPLLSYTSYGANTNSIHSNYY